MCVSDEFFWIWKSHQTTQFIWIVSIEICYIKHLNRVWRDRKEENNDNSNKALVDDGSQHQWSNHICHTTIVSQLLMSNAYKTINIHLILKANNKFSSNTKTNWSFRNYCNRINGYKHYERFKYIEFDGPITSFRMPRAKNRKQIMVGTSIGNNKKKMKKKRKKETNEREKQKQNGKPYIFLWFCILYLRLACSFSFFLLLLFFGSSWIFFHYVSHKPLYVHRFQWAQLKNRILSELYMSTEVGSGGENEKKKRKKQNHNSSKFSYNLRVEAPFIKISEHI